MMIPGTSSHAVRPKQLESVSEAAALAYRADPSAALELRLQAALAQLAGFLQAPHRRR